MKTSLRKLWAISTIAPSALLLVVACMSENMEVLTLLKNLQITGIGGVPITQALSFPPKVYVCVLEPYGDDVDSKFAFAADINSFLKKQQFRGEEGKWTFVYGIDKKWQIVGISRRNLELSATSNSGSERIDLHVCGYSDLIRVVKLSERHIYFIRKGAK